MGRGLGSLRQRRRRRRHTSLPSRRLLRRTHMEQSAPCPPTLTRPPTLLAPPDLQAEAACDEVTQLDRCTPTRPPPHNPQPPPAASSGCVTRSHGHMFLQAVLVHLRCTAPTPSLHPPHTPSTPPRARSRTWHVRQESDSHLVV